MTNTDRELLRAVYTRKRAELFDLRVSVCPDDGVPGIQRIKMMLKSMLRSWRVRCISIQPAGEDAG